MRIILNTLTDELRRLKAAGATTVAVSDESLAALRRAASISPRSAPARIAEFRPEPVRSDPVRAADKTPAVEASGASLPPPPEPNLPKSGSKQERWEALKAMVLGDEVCRRQVRRGKKVVLGVGNLDAKIMFVGEAPGAEEELQGEPFVGPAGQLLNKMILGMGLRREDVYIGNIMNWRPQIPANVDGVQLGNRPPTAAELAYCLPYLRAQIEVVDPAFLVALGATATQGLLGPGTFKALGEVRGRWREYAGRPLMITYHPSYILRNPVNRSKRMIWEDLLKVMQKAGLPISDKQRNYFLDR